MQNKFNRLKACPSYNRQSSLWQQTDIVFATIWDSKVCIFV